MAELEGILESDTVPRNRSSAPPPRFSPKLDDTKIFTAMDDAGPSAPIYSTGGQQNVASASQQMSQVPTPGSTSKPKGEDYVYFKRETDGFSSDAVSRATAAKLKLESYYKVAVDAAIERNSRYFPRQLTQTPPSYSTNTGGLSWRSSWPSSKVRAMPKNAKSGNTARRSRSTCA